MSPSNRNDREKALEAANWDAAAREAGLPVAALEFADDSQASPEELRSELKSLGDRLRARGAEPSETTADALFELFRAAKTKPGAALLATHEVVRQVGEDTAKAKRAAADRGESYKTPNQTADPLTKKIHGLVLKHDPDTQKRLNQVVRWTNHSAKKSGVNPVALSQYVGQKSRDNSDAAVTQQVVDTFSNDAGNYDGYDAMADFRDMSIDSTGE